MKFLTNLYYLLSHILLLIHRVCCIPLLDRSQVVKWNNVIFILLLKWIKLQLIGHCLCGTYGWVNIFLFSVMVIIFLVAFPLSPLLSLFLNFHRFPFIWNKRNWFCAWVASFNNFIIPDHCSPRFIIIVPRTTITIGIDRWLRFQVAINSILIRFDLQYSTKC